MMESVSKQYAWTDGKPIGSGSPGLLVLSPEQGSASAEQGSSLESQDSSQRSQSRGLRKADKPPKSSNSVNITLSKVQRVVSMLPSLPTKVHFRNKEAKQREINVRASVGKSIFRANEEGSSAVIVTSLGAQRLFLSHCWRNVDLKLKKNEMFSHLTEKARLCAPNAYIASLLWHISDPLK